VAGSPIAHVIVVIQENRTLDNLFGSSVLGGGRGYPGADTTMSALLHDGTHAALAPIPFEIPYTPLHMHPDLVAEWNNGAMNGFDLDRAEATQPGYAPPVRPALGFVPDFETTLYHALAYRYALADRMFASRLTPTFPGHQFLIAGQGPADDPIFPAPKPSAPPANENIWGCDSEPGTTAAAFTTGENTIPGPVCFHYDTLATLLDRAGVTWRYYTGAIGTYDGSVSAYDAVQPIRSGPDWLTKVVSPPGAIDVDIANCNLPSVSYVTPPETASDLSGTLGAGGPAWIATMYIGLTEALMQTDPRCRYYNDTAILLTWDDSGGWYDHVLPPKDAQGNSWGMRVPLVVISGWAHSNYVPDAKYLPYVSHTPREFGSIIRYIEKNFGLGSLGTRDASADDLHDMFDYTRAAPIPPIPNSVMNEGAKAALANGSQLPWTEGVVDRE
jgi:phospholipase C